MTVDEARLARIKAAESAGLTAGLTIVDAKPLPPAASDWNYGKPVDQWLGDDEPDEDDSSDWHIRGLVARDVVQFLAGDPKVGKTMIMESLAVALASGADNWCGFKIYGRKRVLVAPREDADRTTATRLWQLARGAGIDPRSLGDWLSVDTTSPLNFAKPEHMQKLEAASDGFDIIFVDSFTTAHLGDENSSRDIAAALEAPREFVLRKKKTLVVVHHYNGKGNTDDKRGVKHRLRGSSAIAGYARHIVGVSHGPKRGQLEISSDGNFEYQVKPTIFELVKGATNAGKKTLSYKLIGSAEDVGLAQVRAEVVAAVEASENGFASANTIWKEVGGKRGTVLAAVKAELRVPDGKLELRAKRIHSRKPVLVPVGNHSVLGTGTGTPPLEGVPGTAGEPPPEWWDR